METKTELNPAISTEGARLHMRGLFVGYQVGSSSNVLFENLNLSLFAGKLVCFMGPNGIGKSTLIRTLAGLQKPLGGEVSLNQNDPEFKTTNSSPHESTIAVVLTDRIAATNMSVLELVTYGRYPFLGWNIKLGAQDEEAIQKSIEEVRLSHLVNQKLYELSDGQLQMAMIARALAQDTPILLLDEPTAHLDLNNRLEIMMLLKNICRTKGKAILMATHELDLALQTADLVWLATHAKAIQCGIPEDLVLDGSFDKVFQFKGFDLKTGKVNHDSHRSVSVHLVGEGPEYLWTKNALERNGYAISDISKIEIVVESKNELVWKLSGGKNFDSLSQLLEELKMINV